MALIRRSAAVVFLLSIAIAGWSSSDAWKRFISPKGFSVMYPPSWFRQHISPGRLDILSSRGHAGAVVIERGEAEIFAVEEPSPPRRTLAQVVQHYVNGGEVIFRRNVPKRGRGACERLEEVVFKAPVVPPEDVPAYMRPRLEDFIYTGFFCGAKGRAVVLMLKSWEGDPRQAGYQETARRMASSIRIFR